MEDIKQRDNPFSEGGHDGGRETTSPGPTGEETNISSPEEPETSSSNEPKMSSGEEDETLSEIETKNSMIEARGDGSELGARHVTYQLFGSETFRTPPEAGEQKVKVGFTFRKSVKDRLDKFCAVMNAGDGPRAAKSEVAEAAVDLFLRGWELLGRGSFVIKWLRERVNGS